MDGVVTIFVSASYQVKDPAGQAIVTKYYEGGAFRVGNTLYYGLGDHLGSTSVTVAANGAKFAEMRYTAWGEVRFTSGATPTDRTYTGQRSYASDFGLMYYNARWYDSSLAHFAQADNIDVKPGDTQSLDRFGYVSYNPVKNSDSTGHCIDGISTIVCVAAAGALIGGAISTSVYIVAAHATGQDITLAGAAGAFAGGAVAGAVGVVAAPIAGTLLAAVGASAAGTALVAGTAAVNAVGGSAAYLAEGYTQNAVDSAQGNQPTFQPTVPGLLANAAIAGVISPLAGKVYPVPNNLMGTLKQAEYFIPGRTLGTLFSTQSARNLYAQSLTSVGYGAYLGSFVPQAAAPSY
jgi:RHS repeat-associated protein